RGLPLHGAAADPTGTGRGDCPERGGNRHAGGSAAHRRSIWSIGLVAVCTSSLRSSPRKRGPSWTPAFAGVSGMCPGDPPCCPLFLSRVRAAKVPASRGTFRGMSVKIFAFALLACLASSSACFAADPIALPTDAPLVRVDWQDPWSLPRRFRNHCSYDITNARYYCSDHFASHYQFFYC